MNLTSYINLLNKPDAVNSQQILALEKILTDFPYFQSARSLHLKSLYKEDSFKYNQSLKSTAAYTTDRSVLFDLITSENFIGIQKDFFEEKENQLLAIQVVDSKNVSEIVFENTLEQSILSSINESGQTFEEKIENSPIDSIKIETTEIEHKLEIGKPINFTKNETHSFQEWLQLSKIKPIIREENDKDIVNNAIVPIDDQLKIIDKFIETNPKIPPVNQDVQIPTSIIKTEDTPYLMTETLAKVYLEQKKYSKAIQAYEILILKYPEKSSLFANRILDIQLLQQNNNS